MKIAIIRYTEGTGRTYIVDITTDPDKWLVDNNSTRDKEEYEKLSDFDIEWTTLKHYKDFIYVAEQIKNIAKDIKEDKEWVNDSHTFAEHKGVVNGLDRLIRHLHEINNN